MFSRFFKKVGQRTTASSQHRKFKPQLEFLENRELLSGNPIAGVAWTADVGFHGQYDGSAAHRPHAADFKVEIYWGDGKMTEASNVKELEPNSDQYMAVASHVYNTPGKTPDNFEVDITNLRDPHYHWVQESHGVYVDRLNSVIGAVQETTSNIAQAVNDLAHATGVAQVAEVVDTVNAAHNLLKGGVAIAQNLPAAGQAAKNILQTLAGKASSAGTAGTALQAAVGESTALAKTPAQHGTNLAGLVTDIAKVNAAANTAKNNVFPVKPGLNPDGSPRFPFVLGVPEKAIHQGTIVLGKWDTWPQTLHGMAEAEKLGGITPNSIKVPRNLAGVANQWGPNAVIPPEVDKMYYSGIPTDGAEQGIYLLEMGVANGRQVIFDVSNVDLNLVKKGYSALKEAKAPLTERELAWVRANPQTFKGKIQFYQNMKPVSWEQLFGKS